MCWEAGFAKIVAEAATSPSIKSAIPICGCAALDHPEPASVTTAGMLLWMFTDVLSGNGPCCAKIWVRSATGPPPGRLGVHPLACEAHALGATTIPARMDTDGVVDITIL